MQNGRWPAPDSTAADGARRADHPGRVQCSAVRQGQATLVAESVRTTWEPWRDEFRLEHQPDWDGFVVDVLLRDVAEKTLEMPSSGVRAEPYQLLLYEEWSFFRRRKDSEKAPRDGSTHWCDASLIAGDLDVEQQEVIGNTPYEDEHSRDPAGESEGKYAGNEGMP
ncbi:hypothetical protein DL771_008798 [Monosporascus sp. 5C6A]|nr:hypothetical protein DL771_008798 [Monosporascus sp. 5C6A]